jgi:hypothetical protein
MSEHIYKQVLTEQLHRQPMVAGEEEVLFESPLWWELLCRQRKLLKSTVNESSEAVGMVLGEALAAVQSFRDGWVLLVVSEVEFV